MLTAACESLTSDDSAEVRMAALAAAIRLIDATASTELTELPVADALARRAMDTWQSRDARWTARERALRASLAWKAANRSGDIAVQVAIVDFGIGDPSYQVRAAVAEAAATSKRADVPGELQLDPCSPVRAAALTQERAEELMREPRAESSWLVLARAARMTKRPLWDLVDQELEARAQEVAETASERATPIVVQPPTPIDSLS